MFQDDRTLVELISFLVFGDSPFENPPENNRFHHFLRIDHPLYRLRYLPSVLPVHSSAKKRIEVRKMEIFVSYPMLNFVIAFSGRNGFGYLSNAAMMLDIIALNLGFFR